MAKIIGTSFGVALILFGVGGLALPNLFGAYCNPFHDLLFMLAGAAVSWAAQKTGPAAFVWSMSLAGVVFFLLGLVGFIWGRPGTSSWADRPPNEKLLVLLPSWLELGWNDHVLNLLFGIGFFVAVVAALAETPPRLRK